MTAVLHLWLASYGRAALILGLAAVIGYPAGRRFLAGAKAAPLAVLLGLALLSLIVCLLSWVHLFTGWSVIAVAALALVASALCARRDLPALRARWNERRAPQMTVIVAFGLLLLALAFFSVAALYPVNGFDATSYHLPLARDLVRHHGLSYDPFVRYSFFPQGGESIFAIMLLLSGNPVRCAALEFSALAVVALLLPCWSISARRGVGTGFVAAIVVLASPDVIYCATTAYVDTWTMGFVVAALLVGLDGASDPARRRSSFALMGVFIGAAASAKYTGLLFGGLAGVGVLVATWRSPLAIWREIAVALVGVCVLALPWYAWTIHTAGDPLYPFALGVFGAHHGLWTPNEIAFQNVVARATPTPGFSSILHQDLRYLAGDTPYDTGQHRSPLSWLLGAGVIGLALPRARRDRIFLGTLLAGVLSVVASLQLSADPRYTVPAVGPLAVAAGLAAGHVWALLQRVRMKPLERRVFALGALVATAVIGLWTSAGFARDVYRGGKPPVTGKQVYAYVAARVPCYTAIEWLNRNAGPHYRAWGYVCEEVRYYARGLLISDTFSTGSRMRIFDNDGAKLPSPTRLWERLLPLRVGWMILPTGVPPNPGSIDSPHRFRLVTGTGTENIYRVMN